MQNFDIVKKSSIDKTFRVAKIMADFDLKTEHSDEHFVGNIEMPENWQIGVIVGGSGTGKTTIAKELFQENIIQHFEYTHKSVIDDMPQNVDMETIEKMFYSVGFGSVPSWLKPYSVLSNGEKCALTWQGLCWKKNLLFLTSSLLLLTVRLRKSLLSRYTKR